MNDKSDLLGQLKIDRNEKTKSGVSAGWLIVLVLLAATSGVLVTWWFKPTDTSSGTSQAANLNNSSAAVTQEAAVNTDSEPQTATTKPETNTAPASDRILNASGYITARRMATVSAEIMGLITDVTVEEGMSVQQGQVLAKLDDALARVNLNHAEAQVKVQVANIESIKANLAEARRILQRVTKLKDSEFSSESAITGAQANVDSLQASLAGAQANIEVAKLEVTRQRERLDDYTIRAPFSGVVTEKNAQPGEIVAPSSAGGGFTRTGICTIVDMASLEIEVDVNEAFIGRVHTDQRVEANLDAYPDWTIPASVAAIIPTADRAKATVRVRIRIEEEDPRILPDMGVKVAFLKD